MGVLENLSGMVERAGGVMKRVLGYPYYVAYLFYRAYGHQESKGGMEEDWFKMMLQQVRRYVEHSSTYLGPISSACRKAWEDLRRAASGLWREIRKQFEIEEYNVSRLPDYLEKLYKAAGSPVIYYAGFLRSLGRRAAQVLGLYDMRAIYLRGGLDKIKEYAVLAHELMHALQNEEGLLRGWLNPFYRLFIEGMANYFAIKYLEANGMENGANFLSKAYRLPTMAFEEMFNNVKINYADPQSISTAMKGIKAKLRTYYRQFLSNYASIITGKYLKGFTNADQRCSSTYSSQVGVGQAYA